MDVPTNNLLEEGIAEVLANSEDVRFGYVFGSVARGGHRADSDVDVAIDMGRRLEVDELQRLRSALEKTIKRRVDLVDIIAAGPILRFQVLRDGKLIVCNNRRALAEFQMYTPSLYEDFRRMRKPIEDTLMMRYGGARG